jgi:hypothetical protein
MEPTLGLPVDVVSAVDPQLLQFVRNRDVECPGCGYNLRNLCNDRCPECGQKLEIALRLAEPRQGALIAGLVGLASGFGLGGLLLVYFLVLLIRMPDVAGASSFARFLFVNSTGFVVHGVAVLFWVRQWNRIRRTDPFHRRLLVLGAWLMPITFAVILGMCVR